MKPIAIVHGINELDFCRENMPAVQVGKWVCYDGLSGDILAREGRSVVDAEAYFQDSVEDLRAIGDRAVQLSAHWFEGVDGSPRVASGGPVEKFFIRNFNFTFLAVLRAFYMLKKIREQEGPVEIWAAQTSQAHGVPGSVRWGRSESPVPLLLANCNTRWQFPYKIFPLPHSNKTCSCPFPSRVKYMVSEWCVKTAAKWKSGDVLFSGNPALLEPVRQALSVGRNIRTARVKQANSLKGMIFLLSSEALSLVYPERSLFVHEGALNGLREIHAKRKTFDFEGTDLLPVLWQKIENFYRWEAPRIQRFYETVLSCLRRMNPRMVVVDEDLTESSRVLVDAANFLGIETLVVLHGLPGAPLGFVPLEAKFIAVWGEYTGKVLRQWGVEPSRIVVTGCPKYDALSKQVTDAKSTKRKICALWGWDPAKPVVLALTGAIRENPLELHEEESSDTPERIIETVKIFQKIARNIPEINIVIKLRFANPNISAFVKKILDADGMPPGNFRWISEGLALRYMRAADLVFNSISSACLEAVLIRKPAVQMNFSPHEDTFPFVRYGLPKRVQTFAEAEELCRLLARNQMEVAKWLEDQERIIEPFVLSRDGKSGERVAQWILERLRKRGSDVPA